MRALKIIRTAAALFIVVAATLGGVVMAQYVGMSEKPMMVVGGITGLVTALWLGKAMRR